MVCPRTTHRNDGRVISARDLGGTTVLRLPWRRFGRAILLLLALPATLSTTLGGCTSISMRDANDPDRAGATFRYVGMRDGARSPDYSAIDASILSGRRGATP